MNLTQLNVDGEVINNDSKHNQFLSIDEIIIDVLLSTDKESWKVPQDQLILAHHTTGQYIRNNYKLWYPANPYVQEGKHPDDISMEIMIAVWNHINK